MHTHWGSKLGFVLATAGSAVGLGNIWRFPYLIAQNGGGAFLLVYLLCVGLLGYFLLTAKITFGRIAATNFIDGFQKVTNGAASRLWSRLGGFLTIFNVFFVSAVYVVVIGWTLSYVVASAQNLIGFSSVAIDKNLFETLTASYGTQLFWGILCIVVTSLILIRGVKGGIEKTSLYLMPFLFLLLIFMVAWMFMIPGSEKGLKFLFTPNWADLGITESGFDIHKLAHVALLALGQAIYSLSLGMGVCFIYGSYLKPNTDIKKSGLWVVILDTLVATLASMIVVPAVFAFGLESNQGPGLSFITLPFVFSQMAGGKIFMFVFFLLLFVAALTSLISIYEPVINLLIERKGLSRKMATMCVAGMNVILSAVVLASFTGHLSWTILGKNLFDCADYVTGSYTMGLMVLIYCVFMGWKIWPQIRDNLKIKNKIFENYFSFVIKILSPIILVLLFIMA
ncbi:MAG: sodium-dependent transporter [Alphaproteobacteria bacterium]|nr:sodium-dependent transporter [Alphaproteobacteria bacterium]